MENVFLFTPQLPCTPLSFCPLLFPFYPSGFKCQQMRLN